MPTRESPDHDAPGRDHAAMRREPFPPPPAAHAACDCPPETRDAPRPAYLALADRYAVPVPGEDTWPGDCTVSEPGVAAAGAGRLAPAVRALIRDLDRAALALARLALELEWHERGGPAAGPLPGPVRDHLVGVCGAARPALVEAMERLDALRAVAGGGRCGAEQ